MLSFLPRWRTVAGVVAAAAMSLALVVPVSAAATISYFTETTTNYDPNFTDDCTGASGPLTEVFVVDGQTVVTSTGFHVEGTVTITASVAFNNGTYGTSTGTERFSFTAAPALDVITQVHMETATLYSADGQVLKSWTFRFVYHLTLAKDGTVRVEFEKVHDGFFC
jgi:hypothetical protein